MTRPRWEGLVEQAVSVKESLERIEELDHKLNSVIAVDPEAVEASRARESELLGEGPLGPLHGMPLMVKDNIDTAGSLPTTAGSIALSGNIARRDAPVVGALRAAGAVVVAKTNLSEWANFRSTRAASGWSAAGGLTCNPYVLDRSAGGSSSGSAAAVAAGLAPVALGTETDGSILCPAALCGCVGLKPTVGLTSRDGVVPISSSQDTVGPITRSVCLAAAVLDALCGGDHIGAIESGSKGLRVGLVTSGREVDSKLEIACDQALRALRDGGVGLVEPVELEVPDDLWDDELEVLLHEFRAGITEYLSKHPGAVHKTLADLITYNEEHPEELAHFGQELFEKAEKSGDLDAPGYRESLERCRKAGREDGIDAALARADVDALAAPSYPPAWKSDLVNGDPKAIYSISQLPAVAGYPAITVPVGFVGELPVGLTLFSTANSEPVLLRLAQTIEAVLGPLDGPRFREPQPG